MVSNASTKKTSTKKKATTKKKNSTKKKASTKKKTTPKKKSSTTSKKKTCTSTSKKTSTRRVITKPSLPREGWNDLTRIPEGFIIDKVDEGYVLELDKPSPPRNTIGGQRQQVKPYTPKKETLTETEIVQAKAAALTHEKEVTINISTPVPRTSMVDGSSPAAFMNGLDSLAITNLKWNHFIPNTPSPKQLAALLLPHITELLYGGALGGGKSDWLAMEALRYCDLPGFSGILFRRQLTDLSQPGALIERVGRWLEPHKQAGACKYDGTNHIWNFKTCWPGTDIPGPPAQLQFGYIGVAEIRQRYMSAEYQFVGFDELGQWPDDIDYLFMMTRIRKNVCPIHKRDANNDAVYVKGCRYCDVLSQIPLRMRAASNPGPAWMKRRFGIKPDPAEYPTARHALIAIAEGKKVKWVGTNPEARFLPAYLWDNPHLDYKAYNKMLKELPDHERSRLQDGNWEARVDARFKRSNQKFVQLNLPEPFLQQEPNIKDFGRNYFSKYANNTYDYIEYDSKGHTLIREGMPFSSLKLVFSTVDVAVSVAKGPVDLQVGKKNSWTVISIWGITEDDNLLWLHRFKFKREIPDVIQALIERNQIWTPTKNKIEVSGVGIGVAQWMERAGYPVTKNWKKTDKLENSMSAQMLMKRFRVLFPANAQWLEEAEDVIFNWTGLPEEEDDDVDTLSDAANELGPKIARELAETSNPDIDMTKTAARPLALPFSSPGVQGSRLALGYASMSSSFRSRTY